MRSGSWESEFGMPCGTKDDEWNLTVKLLLADRVFGPGCQTRRVYEEGAKDVALSALAGSQLYV
jgi:hypothetical protein